MAIGVYGLKSWAITRFPKTPSAEPSQPKSVEAEFGYQGEGEIKMPYASAGPYETVSLDEKIADEYKDTIRIELRDGKMVEKSYMPLDSHP